MVHNGIFVWCIVGFVRGIYKKTPGYVTWCKPDVLRGIRGHFADHSGMVPSAELSNQSWLKLLPIGPQRTNFHWRYNFFFKEMHLKMLFTKWQPWCSGFILLNDLLFPGSIMDSGHGETGSKHSDLSTLKATMETVIRAHYPDILGHIAWRLVPCPHICAETLRLLAR